MTNSKLCLFLFGVLYSTLAFCQNNYSFKRLGVNEGLSQNSVREIFQDKQGFIWIGTGDGLNRYDGKQIKKYRESFRDKSSKRFPGKIITGKIVQDDRQNLWMIVDGSVVKMNLPTETFSVIKKIGGDLDCRILAICKNQLFVTTPKTVVAININNLSHRTFPLTKAFGVYNAAGGAEILFQKRNSIYRYHIKRNKTSLLLSIPNADIFNPAMCNNTSILFSSDNKLHDYNLALKQVTASYSLPYDEKTNKQLVLLPTAKTPSGDIIAAVYNKGFVVIDSVKNNFYNYQHINNDPLSLSSNLVYTSMIDHSGNLWLGTEGGGISILNLKPELFRSFPPQAVAHRESSLLMVKSIYYAEPNIYIGTYSKGLYEVNRFSQTSRQLFDPKKKAERGFHGIFFIKKDSKDQIWMNVGSKVGIVDLPSEKFLKAVNIKYVRKQRSHNIPQCFAQIDSNKFMLGTFYSTYLIEKIKDNLLLTDLGLLDHRFEDDIQTIYKKENGDIIIGKGEGKGYITVRILAGGTIKILEAGLQNLTVKHVYRDTMRKALWFGTNVGIVIQRDGQQKPEIIDVQNGLSNDFIYSILAENNYSFWVSTNKGLNKINLAKGNDIIVSSVEQYDIQHGLQSNEFNTGAFFKDGHLLFLGGVTGINWFDARKFYKRTFDAKSYITEVLVNEQTLASDTIVNFLKLLRFKYDENNIVIKFATLDYTNPDVHQYQYRLKDYDAHWINAGNIPEARYSRLPHGSYQFEVRSSNHEGVWSVSKQLLSLTITPPFWLTWWFKILAFITSTAIIFWGTRYFLRRRLDAQIRIIEKKLAVNNERLRISRDMHDELGTGLSKIALLSEVGKKRLPHDTRIINEISATSRGLTDKMGEIIWTLNPQNDTLGNLAAYLKEYIYETTESLPVSVVINFPEVIPEVNLTHFHRQQLMLVTKEALNNALKYACATQISFSLLVTEKSLAFHLKDDGVGFDPAAQQLCKNGKRNGLENMKARMDSIGGYFSIRSNHGTEINYGLDI